MKIKKFHKIDFQVIDIQIGETLYVFYDMLNKDITDEERKKIKYIIRHLKGIDNTWKEIGNKRWLLKRKN